MFVPPINAICGVETDKLWILVESLSKWDETITLDLSHALAFKFSPSTT